MTAESPPGYTFTIFTPTRNRAHALPRVYESLTRQTFRNFEWLVIDNDSTDETPDLIARWQQESTFPIRYLRQPNRGVHHSWNLAAREAKGRLFLAFRSADTCTDDALERFLHHWEAIPADRRDRFVGVTCLAVDEHGRFIGRPFPTSPLDSDSLETRYRYKVTGEKWGFQRTDVLRRYPLPEIDGYAGYVPEGIMWAAIARSYRTRYVNETLRVYWQDQATSVSQPRERRVNAPGSLLEAREFLNHDLRWFRYAPAEAYLKAAKYGLASLYLGHGLVAQWGGLRTAGGRLLWLAGLPAALAIYLLDTFRPRRPVGPLPGSPGAGGTPGHESR